MEQHPQFAAHKRIFFVLAAAVAVAMVGVAMLAWPRRVGQKKSGVVAAAETNAAAPAAKEAFRFTEHFCSLSSPFSGGGSPSTQAVDGPARGWSRLRDAVHCFAIDYPKQWRMEDTPAALHFWAPDTDGANADGSYWDADLSVLKPYQTAEDERAEYDAFAKKAGVISTVPGVLVGPWERMVNGDGSFSLKVSQERKVFNGRGEFTIVAQADTKDGARKALLETIADTFKAQ